MLCETRLPPDSTLYLQSLTLSKCLYTKADGLENSIIEPMDPHSMLCTTLGAEPVFDGVGCRKPETTWALKLLEVEKETLQERISGKTEKCLVNESSSRKSLAFSLSVPGLQGSDGGWSLWGKLLLPFPRMMSQNLSHCSCLGSGGEGKELEGIQGHLVKLGWDVSILQPLPWRRCHWKTLPL